MTYKITALTPFVPNILDDGSVLNADNHQISLPRDLQAEFMHKPGGQFFSFGVIDADDPRATLATWRLSSDERDGQEQDRAAD